MTHSELERELEKKGQELMRVLLQEHLDRRGPGQCEQPVCGADGVERTRKRFQSRNLETVFGIVTATRTGYGKEGIESLHPSDAELNLPDEKYSLELCRRASVEAANISFDEARERVDNNTAGHIPKRQIEELVRRSARDFDPFYERRRCNPFEDGGTGSLLIISVDGKGIVLHEKDLREQTRRAAENRTHKMDRRLSKGEKKNAKRMATVATVFTTEPFKRTPEDLVAESGCALNKEKRPPPERKRVWASIEKTTDEVVEEAFCEACHRDPIHEKQWVALVDGDKTQIRILRGKAKEKGIELTIIVDIIHVIEYLWKAGKAFHSESGPELENWVRHRLLEILRG
ncbi:MAG: ISKra4 family transposase, partial [Proteobacteria bacterium]|nr:ISKra4 family transposase [Pseudomonadota bacterium]